MAKRLTGKDLAGFGVIILIAAIAESVAEVVKAIGWVTIFLVIAVIGFVVIWARGKRYARRLAYFRGKYGDETVARNIMAHRYWEGQTSEQLRDSLGPASTMDVKVFKKSEREVWKYYPRGVNRFGLRITVENEVVVGWDQKS